MTNNRPKPSVLLPPCVRPIEAQVIPEEEIREFRLEEGDTPLAVEIRIYGHPSTYVWQLRVGEAKELHRLLNVALGEVERRAV